MFSGYCQPEGLVDVTDCYYGFPISLSYPHFMNGDPDLIKNITGMQPNADDHSSVFVIQPVSFKECSIYTIQTLNLIMLLTINSVIANNN